MAAAAALLPRERNLILAALLVVAAAAWALLAWQAVSMDMRMAGPTMGLAAPLFLMIWITMMVAMMFPTAAPFILTFHSIQVGKRQKGRPFVHTWIFVAVYLLMWTGFGVVAYVLALGAQAVAGSLMWPSELVARIGAALIAAAGLYQFSSLKRLCLSKCRSPMSFILTSWRDGVGGAILMGLHHGLYCLGCCWLLFVILFPIGVMNVAAMALITVLIFAEKAMPRGERIGQAAALGLVLYGIAIFAMPQALPTFPAAGRMEHVSQPGVTSSEMAPPAELPSMPPSSMPGM